jgi:RNA polymerase sigma factor (sigma-70 family)
VATSSGHVVLDRWVTCRDSQSFKAIVDRYGGMVYATCCRVLQDTIEAEDVTQECFEVLVRVQEPPKDYLGPWLHRVATNLCIKHRRAAGRRIARETAYSESRPQSTGVEWNDIYDLVDEALQELPDDLRIPLTAHYLDGASHATIAVRLKVPRRTISSRIARGIELLGIALRKRGVTAPVTVLAGLMGTNMSQATAVPATLTHGLGKLALSLSTTHNTGVVNVLASIIGANTMKIATIAVTCLVVVTGLTVLSEILPGETEKAENPVLLADAGESPSEPSTTTGGAAPANVDVAPEPVDTVAADYDADSDSSEDLLAYILDQQDQHIEAVERFSYEAEYSLTSKIRFDEAELSDMEAGKSSPILGGFDSSGWWRFKDEGMLNVAWQSDGQFVACSSVPMNHIVRTVSNPNYTARIYVVLDGRLPAMEQGLGTVKYRKHLSPPYRDYFDAALQFDPIMTMYGNGHGSLRDALSRKSSNFIDKAAWKEGNIFHIRLQDDAENTWHFEIDPLKGFSIVSFAFASERNDPRTDMKRNMKLVPQEIEPGLWFPLAVEKNEARGVLSATKEEYLESTWTLRIRKVMVNTQIPAEQFTAAALGPEAQGREFMVEEADGRTIRATLVNDDFVTEEGANAPAKETPTDEFSTYDADELTKIIAEKSKGNTDAAKILSKSISLQIQDTSLDRAIEVIGNYVKVEFRIDNTVPETTNIAEVSVRSKSLHEVLTSMLEPLGLDYEYEPSGPYLLIRPATSS